jgi:hypothetical protein
MKMEMPFQVWTKDYFIPLIKNKPKLLIPTGFTFFDQNG